MTCRWIKSLLLPLVEWCFSNLRWYCCWFAWGELFIKISHISITSALYHSTVCRNIWIECNAQSLETFCVTWKTRMLVDYVSRSGCYHKINIYWLHDCLTVWLHACLNEKAAFPHYLGARSNAVELWNGHCNSKQVIIYSCLLNLFGNFITK